MKFLPKLFENNRAWAERIKLEDPQYFQRLSRSQTREYLCAIPVLSNPHSRNVRAAARFSPTRFILPSIRLRLFRDLKASRL